MITRAISRGPGLAGLRAPLALAALLAALAPAPAWGQDVVRQGRPYGIAPSEATLEILRRDPDAFEFRRAWRQKTARVREQRAALERRSGVRLSVAQLRSAAASVTGTFRVPVIMGLYAGRTAPYTPAQYQDRLFADVPTRYSATTFYREISRGLFSLDGTVTPWVSLPQDAAYYNSPSTSANYGRTGEYLRDALAGADGALDFGQFDNDGPDGVPNSGDDDGYVDAAAFVYPEHGRSCGGPGIWPHRWTYSSWFGAPYSTNDRAAGGGMIRVDDYLIQNGVACDGTSLMGIGTFSHEMGHALGLPDLYDTYAADGDGEGAGEWDLMGSGNHNRQDYPAHMGAWSKDFLGWVGVEVFTSGRVGYTLDPVYQAGKVLRFNIAGTREYFLMEHRNTTGSDRYLRRAGLLVWHVDPVVIDSTRWSNRVNAHARRGVALEEADGRDDLLRGVNRSDTGDPFPGSTGRTSFGAQGTPNSHSNNGAASGLELSRIALAGGILTFDIGVGTTLVLVGDPSGDGQITTLDAMGVLSQVVGKPLPAGWRGGVAADTNCDGAVTALDALVILSRVVQADVSAFCIGSRR